MAVLKFNPTGSPLFNSFLGLMDIKLGVLVISFFGILNKVAGVYGIMAVFTGGTLSQVSMYLYSLATIMVILWGLKAISDENGNKTLMYAHLYALDHLLCTTWTVFFAVLWWFYNPHDGKRQANSDAQKQILHHGSDGYDDEDDEERTRLAQKVWKSERSFAGIVLVLGWFAKVYFILCLYSFAMHLRRGTYHGLKFNSSRPPNVAYMQAPDHPDDPDDPNNVIYDADHEINESSNIDNNGTNNHQDRYRWPDDSRELGRIVDRELEQHQQS